MQTDKSLLIAAGFLALFVIYYFTGWVCDSKYRLVMRKTKLSSFKKILFHFKGTKLKENRGHAIACVRLEAFSFVNIVLGVLCFAAVRLTGNTLVFLACGALGAMSFAAYVFQMYVNIMKYRDRKKQLDEMDETGFAEYREKETPVPVTDTAEKKVTQPTMAASRGAVSPDDKVSSMESGREILRTKGLLDDDIFSPFVSDVSDKFTTVKAKESFADGSDIEKGKAALENFAGKQLSTDAFFKTARFEDARNAYESAPPPRANDEDSRSVRDVIDEHRDEINPENQFKPVNKNSPVRKDDEK